jgi:hypothetical protein
MNGAIGLSKETPPFRCRTHRITPSVAKRTLCARKKEKRPNGLLPPSLPWFTPGSYHRNLLWLNHLRQASLEGCWLAPGAFVTLEHAQRLLIYSLGGLAHQPCDFPGGF